MKCILLRAGLRPEHDELGLEHVRHGDHPGSVQQRHQLRWDQHEPL